MYFDKDYVQENCRILWLDFINIDLQLQTHGGGSWITTYIIIINFLRKLKKQLVSHY